jgi:hypothetical protein
MNPNFAKNGGLHIRSVEGEAEVAYHNPLTALDLKSSGFPQV